MKDKLINLLNTSRDYAVQAIELNNTIDLLSEDEIENILEGIRKKKGSWVHQEFSQKLKDLDKEWQSFLDKQKYLDRYGSMTIAMKSGFYPLLHGQVQVSIIPNNESLAEYGQGIGNPIIFAEEKVLSWLKKHPLVKDGDKPQAREVGTASMDYFHLEFTVEIELVSLSKILSL